MNIFDLVESSNPEIFRRLYINPPVTGAIGMAFPTWTSIAPEKIKSYGRLSFNANNIGTYQDQFPSIQIELDNVDGYFNIKSDTSDLGALFYNAYTRNNSFVKLEVGFKDTDGTEYPSNPICFLGIIGQNSVDRGDGSIVFSVENYFEKLYGAVTVGAGTGFPNTTSVYYTVWESLKIDGLVPLAAFEQIPEYGYDNIYTDVNTNTTQLRLGAFDTASVADISFLDFYRTMAQMNNQRLFQSVKGVICLAQYELDEIAVDKTGSITDTNCIFHATLNDTLTSEIGNNLTSSTGTPAYAAGYFGNGFISDLSGTQSYIQLAAQNNFNAQRFCIQFWYQPQNFNISDGTAPETIAMFAISLTTHYGTDYIKAGFSFNDQSDSAAVGELIIEKKNTFDDTVLSTGTFNYSSIVNSNAALNLTAGSNGFFAFVHDAWGINGSLDIWRIYFAHEDDTVASLIASIAKQTYGTCGIRTMCGEISGSKVFDFLPLSAGSATGTAVIDDIKIYNYAKTDFSDFKTEAEYFKKKKYYVQGPTDTPSEVPINIIGDIQWRYAYDKIVNDITVTYSGGSYNYGDGSSSYGDGTSGGKYGIKPYNIDAPYLSDGTALQAATNIYNKYSEPKLEITAKLKFFPYINLFDEMVVNYQSQNGKITTSTEYLENQSFDEFSAGTSLVTAGIGYFTEVLASAVLTLVATDTTNDVVAHLYDSTDLWAGVIYNNDAALATEILSVDIPLYPGGRWGITYKHSSFGGLWIQHIPGSELRVIEFNGLDPVASFVSIAADWDALAPSTVSNVRVDLSNDDEMTLFIDNISIATYTDTTYTVGTFGFVAYGEGGFMFNNLQIYSLGVNVIHRQLDLLDKTMQVVKVEQDFDKLETSVVLREID